MTSKELILASLLFFTIGIAVASFRAKNKCLDNFHELAILSDELLLITKDLLKEKDSLIHLHNSAITNLLEDQIKGFDITHEGNKIILTPEFK